MGDTLLEGMDTHQEDMDTLRQDMDIQQGAMDTLQEVTLLDTPLQEDTLLEDMDTPLEDMDTLQEVTPLDIPTEEDTLDLLEVDTTQDIPMENRNLNDDGSETTHSQLFNLDLWYWAVHPILGWTLQSVIGISYSEASSPNLTLTLTLSAF